MLFSCWNLTERVLGPLCWKLLWYEGCEYSLLQKSLRSYRNSCPVAFNYWWSRPSVLRLQHILGPHGPVGSVPGPPASPHSWLATWTLHHLPKSLSGTLVTFIGFKTIPIIKKHFSPSKELNMASRRELRRHTFFSVVTGSNLKAHHQKELPCSQPNYMMNFKKEITF